MRWPHLGQPKVFKKKNCSLYNPDVIVFDVFFANGLRVWARLTVRRSHTRLVVSYNVLVERGKRV